MSDRKRTSWLAWSMFLLPVFYLASIPPLNWCDVKGYIPRGGVVDSVLQVYAFPWIVVYRSVPGDIRSFMTSYAELLTKRHP